MNDASRETFERGMQLVRMLYGSAWDAELAFAAEWADSVKLEDDVGEADEASILFCKDGAEYWFLVGDGSWDADDPRGEMIEVLLAERARGTSACAQNDAIAERVTALCNGVDGHASRDSDGGDRVALGFARQLSAVARTLLAERAKDGEALAVANAALKAAEAKLREVITEREQAIEWLDDRRRELARMTEIAERRESERDNWKESHETLLVEFHERGGRLHELIIEHDSLVMRVGDVASEAFGPFPVQTAAEALSAIEHGCFEARKENAHVTSERDEARAHCTTAQSELLPTIDGLTSINTQLGRELDAMTKARDALGEYTYASSAAEEARIAALRAVGARK